MVSLDRYVGGRMRLKDKVVIVTGGAQGIGREYGLRFANEGAAVAVADLRIEQAQGVEQEIVDGGGQALAIRADVADEASAGAMVKQTVERFGRVDILINNAAIYHDLDLGNQSIDYLRQVLDVNVIGILACGRAVFPYMKDQGGGSIINIASIAAYMFTASPVEAETFSNYAYGLSKSAVIFLTKSMAMTGGPSGIRVNAIAPGVTMSEATKKVVPGQFADMMKGRSALGRSLEPGDLTGTAVYLASDDSALMTGQTLIVDAGIYANG